MILETDLSFSSHVKAVTKSAYYHLKNIARIRCFVSSHDLEKLVHAFITSRVDYCNGLLTGLPKKSIRQLQLIQNAAVRLCKTRCTSLSSLLFILIFIKSHILFFAHPICFAHLTVLLFCTFLYSIAHFTSYFFFLPIYIYIYTLVWCYFYII